MAFQKKLASVLVAGGLVAAAAVPASALENEFHGMFRVMGFISNFNGSPTGQGIYDPKGTQYKIIDEDTGETEGTPMRERTARFVEQRARLFYTAKVSDDLKLVTKFEIDSRWGDDSYGVGRGKGGAIGADQVNIETKNVYLDFNIPSTKINAKVGIQDYYDVFKGIFVGSDMAGAVFSTSGSKGEAGLGLFRFNEDLHGKQTREMAALTGSYNLGKDSKIGAGYYLLLNDVARPEDPDFPEIDLKSHDDSLHTFGINGETKIGKAVVDGFVVLQAGSVNEKSVRAWAANVGSRMPVGPGTLRAEVLYASGDANENGKTNNAFQSVDDEHGYYNGEMMILMRDKYAMTTDNAIIYKTNNQNKGMIGGFLGYDLPFTEKFNASANLGFAGVASRAGNGYLGTEINTELNYKLNSNLTAILRGAYVVLGDHYNNQAIDGTDPANPYSTNLMLNFTF